MNRRVRVLARVLPVVLMLALAAPVVAVAADRPLAAGSQAPDIALSDQHGRPFWLSEALGQREFIVLAFYVKAFTGG